MPKAKAKRSVVPMIASILIIIAALDVGLLTFSNFSIIGLLGEGTLLTIGQALVGLSGLYALIKLFK